MLSQGLGSVECFRLLSNPPPSEEMLQLLDLAVKEGYLVRGFISKKEGAGRRVSVRVDPTYCTCV